MLPLWLDWLFHRFFVAMREQSVDRWGEELARWHSCPPEG